MIFGKNKKQKTQQKKIQKGIMTCLIQSTTKVVCLSIVWSARAQYVGRVSQCGSSSWWASSCSTPRPSRCTTVERWGQVCLIPCSGICGVCLCIYSECCVRVVCMCVWCVCVYVRVCVVCMNVWVPIPIFAFFFTLLFLPIFHSSFSCFPG